MKRTLLWGLLWGLVPPMTAEANPAAEVVIAAIDIRLTPEIVVESGITVTLAQDLALDPETTPYVRARAVSALAALGGEEARRVIEVVAVMDPNRMVRAQAYVSLARAFGPWDRPGISGFLMEGLAGDEAAVTRRIRAELQRLAQGPR